jgi:hypothetical protein
MVATIMVATIMVAAAVPKSGDVPCGGLAPL